MSSVLGNIPALPDLPPLLRNVISAAAGCKSSYNLKISNFPESADDAQIIAMMGGAFGRGVGDEQFKKLIFYKSPWGEISILLKFGSMNHVNCCFVYISFF